MTERRTGGTKEFLFSVVWAVCLLFTAKYFILILPEYKIIGGIAAVAAFAVLGFFVLTHYAAIFTYTLKGYVLRINRKIGGRNKEVEVTLSDVKNISKKKPSSMPRKRDVYVMCTSVFSTKKRYYAEYIRRGVNEVLVFEPSPEMIAKIQEITGTSE